MDSDKKKFAIIAIALLAFAYLSIKLSTPVLPFLATTFHVELIDLKLTGSLFLLSYAFSQVIWGSIVPYYNKRHVIFSAFAISAIGTILAMSAINVWTFALGRIIEGIGVGFGSCLCRVILAEKLNKHEIGIAAFYIGLVFNYMPFIAPSIGLGILLVLNWRWVFAFFLLVTACYAAIIAKYFTGPIVEKVHPKLSIPHVISLYKAVFIKPHFWGFIGMVVLFLGSFLGYYIVIPFWFLKDFHFPKAYYTLLILFTAVPNSIAYFISGRLLKKYYGYQLACFSVFIMMAAALVALICAFTIQPSVFSLILIFIGVAFATGFLQPAVNAALLVHFKKQSGVISGTIPFFGFLGSSAFFFLFSILSLESLWPLFVIIASITIVSGLLAIWLRVEVRKIIRQREQEALEES